MIRQILALALVRLWRTRAAVSCQVLALFAMMAPLLIILGLKYGIVESMKERLLSNPDTLEVRMTDAFKATPELVDSFRKWPETAFVIPSVGYLYSGVDVVQPGQDDEDAESAALIPTAPGDPLLNNTGVPVPHSGEAVVTEALSKRVGLAPGDQVHIKVWRNSRRQCLEIPLRVVGVLPLQHHSAPALLVPLELTVDVENYIIAGQGEPGSPARFSESLYDGIALGEGSTEELLTLLLKQLPKLKSAIENDPRFPSVRLVRSTGSRLTPGQITTLTTIATSSGAEAWPWLSPMQAELAAGDSVQNLLIISSPISTAAPTQVDAPPTIILPPAERSEDHATLRVPSPEGTSFVVCRIEESATARAGEALVSPQLLALLRLGMERRLEWDYRTGGLRFPVMSFSSMRIYSNSLENTEPLMERLQAAGISCRAKVGVIRQVLSLERSLNKLFIVITIGAGIGAVLSFALSLFNAAELHRRDYALVQLLGAGRFSLALMPIVDALCTTAIALLLTFVSFYAVSSIIGLIFAETAGSGTLCRLSPDHILIFCSTCAGIACVASLAAALKVLRISPAEILRES